MMHFTTNTIMQVKTGRLAISFEADDLGIVLNINGTMRYIDYTRCPTEQHLRALLADEPAYVVESVLGLLKEMVK
jgi:hypothetical protein